MPTFEDAILLIFKILNIRFRFRYGGGVVKLRVLKGGAYAAELVLGSICQPKALTKGRTEQE